MTTKQILIIIILIITIGSISIFFVLKPKSIAPNTALTIENTALQNPTPTSVALSTWTDEAGFSFQYPTGTTIDKHPEDSVNYANLTLTFPDKTTAQIIMSDKTATNVATASFTDDDVVVTITGNKDIITKSWQFIYPTPTTGKSNQTSSSSSDSGDVLEEE